MEMKSETDAGRPGQEGPGGRVQARSELCWASGSFPSDPNRIWLPEHLWGASLASSHPVSIRPLIPSLLTSKGGKRCRIYKGQ